MAGAVTGLHIFGPDVGPENLTLLDNNFSPLQTALNSLVSFANNYVDSGAANSLIVTVSAPQVLAAYAEGLLLQVKVAATNTVTNPTINVNSLGAKTIVNPDGSALLPGQLAANGYAQLQYNAVSGQFELVGGGAPGYATTGLFGNGSAPTPSVAFQSSPNTGLYLAAANSLGFSANGVAAGQITANGGWVIAAPVANNTALTINTPNTAGQSFALTCNGGTNATDWSAIFRDQGGNNILEVRGDHACLMTDNAASPTLFQVGFMDIPQNLQNNNYATVASDRGKSVDHQTAGTAHTYTINDATVNYPLGATISFDNGGSSGILTITLQTTPANLVWAPSGSTGARSLAPQGVATARKITTGTPGAWRITGVGLT